METITAQTLRQMTEDSLIYNVLNNVYSTAKQGSYVYTYPNIITESNLDNILTKLEEVLIDCTIRLNNSGFLTISW